ncbi:MAG: HPr family phosphocarrier protein [Oscillospiraceae bacterium]|nr:HPr family phosphocarrier protein [Oscillospiraceae bacterium]
MQIQFASLSDVQEFVGLATLQPYLVQVQDTERTVNAKSFMEMFTLDFSEPLSVIVSGEENEARFALAAKKFIV